mmetsp:Transcript_17647/g.61722  ORF Transcript_17647/g.61722 Transcript_17647/m.61722 type:complete len:1397 (+) Transcript_17647:90-4280(+)
MSASARKASRKSSRYSDPGLGEVVVEIAHAFGSHCGSGLRDAAVYADQAGLYILHPVGRYISFRHLGNGEASFVIESPQVQGISACAINRSRTVVAVCEDCSAPAPRTSSSSSAPSSPVAITAAEPRAAGGPLRTQVTLYSLKTASLSADRQPLRTLGDLGQVGRVVCVALSGDAEATLLAVASQAPEFMLAVLDWRRNEVMGRFKLTDTMDRLAISPSSLDASVVSASGLASLRLWTLPEKKNEAGVGADGEPLAAPAEDAEASDELQDELLALAQPSGLAEVPTHFTDHAWMEPADGSLVACTEHCEVHIISARAGSEPRLLRSIMSPFVLSVGREVLPRSLRCFAGGFLVGGDEGVLALWERGQVDADEQGVWDRQANADAFQHVRSCCVFPGGGQAQSSPAITCVDITTAGEEVSDNLLVGFADNSMGQLTLDDFRQGKNAADGEKVCCNLLCGGFHSGPISCIDVAVQRPIVASACRKDSSVRIWNYTTKRCELKWTFQGEEPTCVGIHPIGYLVAVGFSDKMRVMQILVDELKPYREVHLRSVRTLRFSNGGHLLAVAHSKSVTVFGIRTMAKVAKLQHSQQVVSLCFHSEDKTLTTCSEDGSLVEWNAHTWTKANEFPADRQSGVEAYAVATGGDAGDGQTCVALTKGTKSLVRFFTDCKPSEGGDVKLPEHVQLQALCQHMGMSGPVIFGATSTGALWYHSEIAGRMVMKELALHSGPCLDVRLSADGSTLVTAGEDGTIFVVNVRGLAMIGEGGRGGVTNSDVVMISRGEIQAREEEIQLLASEAAALKVQIVEDAARMQSECIRRVAEARQKDQETIKNLRSKCESLQAQATSREREILRQMKAMEASHVKAADQLETDYDLQILSEADRFRQMEAELRRLVEQLVNLREESFRRVESERTKQHEHLLQRVEEKNAEVNRLKDLIAFSQHRFNTMLDQEAMEQELERDELVRQSQATIEQQKGVEYKLKKEQDTMLRGLDMMEKDRNRAEQEQVETDHSVKTLTEQVDRLQREVNELKQERRDREATLRDKELEIGSFKTKVNTLKKFKHVLDFRLQEVTLSLQPKDDTIIELGGKLKELEEEFENNLQVHKQMEARLKEVDDEIKDKVAEGNNLREVIKARDREIFEFTEDLRGLATNETDVRRWPVGIRAIHRKHVRPERLSRGYGGQAMQELGRQIDVTEKKADRLSIKGRAAEEECQSDLRHRVDDNFDLMHELDKLRKDRKDLHIQVKDFELKVQTAEKKRADAAARKAAATKALALKSPAAMAALEDQDSDYDVAMANTAPHGSFFGARAASQAAARTMRGNSSAGNLRKSGAVHRTHEEKRAMQKLLAAADLRSQQVQMQSLENKLLRDQLAHLERAKAAETSPAAGGGLAAVRRATDR